MGIQNPFHKIFSADSLTVVQINRQILQCTFGYQISNIHIIADIDDIRCIISYQTGVELCNCRLIIFRCPVILIFNCIFLDLNLILCVSLIEMHHCRLQVLTAVKGSQYDLRFLRNFRTGLFYQTYNFCGIRRIIFTNCHIRTILCCRNTTHIRTNYITA